MEEHSSHRPKLSYFSKEILMLKWFGVYVEGYTNNLQKFHTFFIAIVLIFVYTAFDIYESFKHDFEVAATILTYQFAGVLTLCKIGMILLNQKKLFKVITKLHEKPFLPDINRGGKLEEKLVNRAVWITNFQSTSYWVCSVYCIALTIIVSVVIRMRNGDYQRWLMPYGTLTVLNITYSPNYEISLVYQCVCIVCYATTFTTVDLLIAAILVHACYQFKILQNYIKQMIAICNREMNNKFNVYQITAGNSSTLSDKITQGHIDVSSIPWNNLNTMLKRIVKYHLAIIEIAEDIEEAFNPLLLLAFLGSLTMLAFITYRASIVGLGDPRIARYIGESLAATTQVLLFSYWGQRLSHESQIVGLLIYQTDFTGTDVRFQKDLAFIIRRCQNATIITAGKFAQIGLTTFTWFIRTSYSAFMVLNRRNT